MNYKFLVYEKFEELAKLHPEFTTGQLLYSILSHLNKWNFKKSDLLEKTDKEIYAAICKTINSEDTDEDGEYSK
jgi:hypothetical protein